jgi:hypothetical protein
MIVLLHWDWPGIMNTSIAKIHYKNETIARGKPMSPTTNAATVLNRDLGG